MPSAGSAPLSVLDLAPVSTGATVGDALRNSLDLARHVERLGYLRHWVAEHHNMPGIASSAPAVLIAHLASVTTTIRVGSGGVMLPNHQPLVVAEQFGMLEALHPGRIDLGVGRAPGTDQITAHALRRSADPSADDLPVQLAELLAFFRGTFPRITAVPGAGNTPAIWLLGSSDFSARLAAELGMPFSFAHHFMPQNTEAALEIYRRKLQVLTDPRRAVREDRRRSRLRTDRRGGPVAPRPGQALVPATSLRPSVHPPPIWIGMRRACVTAFLYRAEGRRLPPSTRDT
jgi:luciferase family oxidoreductase group 1